jgi:hypothetical protein
MITAKVRNIEGEKAPCQLRYHSISRTCKILYFNLNHLEFFLIHSPELLRIGSNELTFAPFSVRLAAVTLRIFGDPIIDSDDIYEDDQRIKNYHLSFVLHSDFIYSFSFFSRYRSRPKSKEKHSPLASTLVSYIRF